MEGAKERLFKAAVVGDTAVLERLTVEHPAVFNQRNNQGELASHVALLYGHLEFAMKICTYFPAALWELNQTDGDGLLHMAAKLGHREFFLQGARLLSQYSQDENAKRSEYAKAASDCLVNGEGKSLLYLAAEKGYVDAAKLMLEAFSDYKTRCFHPGGPNDTTPLHIATRDRNYDMVQLFLQYAPEGTVRWRDGTGYTPLHIAVLLNEPRLAEMFLTTHPISADILDRDGFSPFHMAVRLNETEMFQLFLRRCPDCCTTLTNKYQSALHIAVERNIEDLVPVIIEDKRMREFVNRQDVNGNTPLHLAAYRDDRKMQDILLGCQVKVLPLRNKEDQTFQEIAKRKQKEKRKEMDQKFVNAMKEFQTGLLVMTTLIITVTFTASFTLPGGYNGGQPDQGMATLIGLTGFDVFLVTNTISMSSSIIATASLVLFSVVATDKQLTTMKVAIGAIVISIVLMLVAVTAGVWVVIGSQRKWLAIFIAVITSSSPLCLIILVKMVMPGSVIRGVTEYSAVEQ